MSERMSTSGRVTVEEKMAKAAGGWKALGIIVLGFVLTTVLFVAGIMLLVRMEDELGEAPFMPGGLMLLTAILGWVVCGVACAGFRVLNPNEALVLTLFGRYYGTIKKQGFYYVNPFAASFSGADKGNTGISLANNNVSVSLPRHKISLKTMTLNNEKQKVNDVLGNPIIIGAIVIWRVADPTKAVFNVENYKKYLSIQCDSTIRNIARLYPYDTMEEGIDERTLRGSSQEIADVMQKELSERVKEAGLEIDEVRITHLSYSEEIAAAMLQRQQAVAIIAARQKIVEGAVSMVKMAIDQLGEEEIVVLDEERKAAMVSNLLVVLCGNKDAQPIVNSGSIY